MKIAAAAMFVACVSTAVPAVAQIGTGTWRWEVSTDGGASWQVGLVHVPLTQAEVIVRAVASWSPEAGPYYGGTMYDVVWEHGSGSLGDTVTGITRYRPFDANGQTLGATRFGAAIKIDDTRDTLPPGEGTLGVASNQLPPGFSRPSADNPAALAEFRFQLDGTPGDRNIYGIFRPPSIGNPVDRFFFVYYGPNYIGNYPLSAVFNSTVRVLCPSDFNRDGQGDFFDYLDFIQAFADEDPSADFNGDGEIDFFDYLDFVEAFAAGC